MKEAAKNKSLTKKWNVSLKVSLAEEEKIKISAIKKGMSVGDYIKKIVLEDLSRNTILSRGKSQEKSLKA